MYNFLILNPQFSLLASHVINQIIDIEYFSLSIFMSNRYECFYENQIEYYPLSSS